MFSVIVLNVFFTEGHYQVYYTQCHIKVYYAECGYAECHCAECRGATRGVLHFKGRRFCFINDSTYPGYKLQRSFFKKKIIDWNGTGHFKNCS
jgi:hypothetical protein